MLAFPRIFSSCSSGVDEDGFFITRQAIETAQLICPVSSASDGQKEYKEMFRKFVSQSSGEDSTRNPG